MLRDAARPLEPEDLPILAMFVHGTPAEEVAATLHVNEEWLTARRWALLTRVLGERQRRPRRAPAP